MFFMLLSMLKIRLKIKLCYLKMGMYWVTYFVSDTLKPTEKILLSKMDPLIQNSDFTRGYVKKEDVSKFTNEDIKITERSYLIEYVFCTLTTSGDLVETRRLLVK